ncbi:EspF repeat-containing protein [Neobacillus jeddahensis]
MFLKNHPAPAAPVAAEQSYDLLEVCQRNPHHLLYGPIVG